MLSFTISPPTSTSLSETVKSKVMSAELREALKESPCSHPLAAEHSHPVQQIMSLQRHNAHLYTYIRLHLLCLPYFMTGQEETETTVPKDFRIS